MAEQLATWAGQDKETFSQIKSDWKHCLCSKPGIDASRVVLGELAKGKWKQNTCGDWVLPVPNVWVFDERGQRIDYEIAVCNDILPSQHLDIIYQLTKVAVGEITDCTYVESGTRGSAGKIKYGGWDLICLYMREIDITGVERLSYMNMLAIALAKHSKLRVPKPIFATSNFFVAPFVEGGPSETLDMAWMHRILKDIREDMLETGLLWNSSIKIDGNEFNYKTDKNGRVFNVDPVYRTGKFVFG